MKTFKYKDIKFYLYSKNIIKKYDKNGNCTMNLINWEFNPIKNDLYGLFDKNNKLVINIVYQIKFTMADGIFHKFFVLDAYDVKDSPISISYDKDFLYEKRKSLQLFV